MQHRTQKKSIKDLKLTFIHKLRLCKIMHDLRLVLKSNP